MDERGRGRRRWLVVLNLKSGTASRARAEGADPMAALRAACEAHGIDVEVVTPPPSPGDGLRTALRHALDRGRPDAIIAAGGDGTVIAVAATLLDHAPDVPLGVIPMGTFNHLAKELGMPTREVTPGYGSPEETDAFARAAVAALLSAEQAGVPFDVAVVRCASGEERPFLNFASLGLHPSMIRERDARLRQGGGVRRWLGKWPAMLAATAGVIWRFEQRRLTLRAPGLDETRVTPAVYVCRNRMQLDKFGLAEAIPDRRGQLGVILARVSTRWEALSALVRAALGSPPSSDDLAAFGVPTLEVATHRPRHVHVALDGEVTRMWTPVRFTLREGAIRVLKPRDGAGGAGTG